MARPEERIDIFLKALGDEWKKQSPDLRFGQFIMNSGMFSEDVFYHEEYEILDKFFPQIPKRDYVIWGTRGVNGDQRVKFLPIKELSTPHIKAILETQHQISDDYKQLFNNEIVYRRKLKIKNLQNKK